MIRKTTIIAIFIIFSACSSIIKYPDMTDLQYCNIKYPESKYTELESGYKLYIRKCGGCHSLYSPRYFSNSEWEKELPEMMKKSKVTKAEELSIRKYIFTMNRDTLQDSLVIPNYKKSRFN